MAKSKIKNTPGAIANRQQAARLIDNAETDLATRNQVEATNLATLNFDQLGLTDQDIINELQRRGYWGYLFWERADVDITERKIEVSQA